MGNKMAGVMATNRALNAAGPPRDPAYDRSGMTHAE